MPVLHTSRTSVRLFRGGTLFYLVNARPCLERITLRGLSVLRINDYFLVFRNKT